MDTTHLLTCAFMARGRKMVAGVAAWSALFLGFVVTAFSLPIDDFWLSVASANAIRRGQDLAHAIDLTWTPMLPGALNPQWGAQLILGGLGSEGWGLVVNAALVGMGLTVTLSRMTSRARAAAVAIAMIVVLGVLAPHLLARAQSFSIALLPVALWLLEAHRRSWWLPIAYGILMVAWANLHGGFVIGQVAAICYLVAEVVSWAIRRRNDASLAIIGSTAVIAMIAPLANPAGIGLIAYAYAQPGLDVVREISIEWQPAWPWVPVASLFWIFLAVLVVGRVLRRGGIPLPDALLGIALAVLAASSIRQIPWFVLAAAPILAGDVDAAFSARPRLASITGGPPPILASRRMASLLLGVGVLALLIQPLRPLLPSSIARFTQDEPVALVSQLAAAVDADDSAAPARVLNEQVWGGYLDFRLGDRVETAMDGRLEIRDRATWAWYFDLLHGEGDPATTLARYGVRWAALDTTRTVLIDKLQQAGWHVVLSTPQGVLLQDPRSASAAYP